MAKIPFSISEARKILNKVGVGGIDAFQMKILKTSGAKIKPHPETKGLYIVSNDFGDIAKGEFGIYHGHPRKADFTTTY